jgi:hypothetical protein
MGSVGCQFCLMSFLAILDIPPQSLATLNVISKVTAWSTLCPSPLHFWVPSTQGRPNIYWLAFANTLNRLAKRSNPFF